MPNQILGQRTRDRAITAANQFTDPIYIKVGGFVEITSTSFTATINVQKRAANGTTWLDITDNSGNIVNLTANGVYTINPQGIAGEYRVGCKTGNFTSATGLTVTIRGK